MPPFTDLAQYPLETARFHPIWLYELLWTALLFLALLWIRRRGGMWPGEIAALALMGYCGGRFLLEFTRVNVSWLGGVNVSQAACLVGFVAGLALLRRFRRRSRALR